MCRDAEVQKQVNAIYGNVSKKILAREIKGETVNGANPQDEGILTEQRLQREIGGDMRSGGGDIKPNPVSAAPREEAWSGVQRHKKHKQRKTTDRIYEYAYSYAVSGTAQG
jgi:hypothetical protein